MQTPSSDDGASSGKKPKLGSQLSEVKAVSELYRPATVTIVVWNEHWMSSDDKETFEIPKGLLVTHFKYFAHLLSSKFKKSETLPVELKDVDPKFSKSLSVGCIPRRLLREYSGAVPGIMRRSSTMPHGITSPLASGLEGRRTSLLSPSLGHTSTSLTFTFSPTEYDTRKLRLAASRDRAYEEMPVLAWDL